jgi:hypothetical protein
METLRRRWSRQKPSSQTMPAAGALDVMQESVERSPEANIQVIYGASVQRLPLIGQTVATARPLLEMILRADPRSPILVNGREVRGNHVITSGDTIEVVHQAGEKGAAI